MHPVVINGSHGTRTSFLNAQTSKLFVDLIEFVSNTEKKRVCV
jgi:hypothetical protein